MWIVVMLLVASSLVARGMRISVCRSDLRSTLHLCAKKPKVDAPPEPLRGKGGVLPGGQKRAMGSRGKEQDAMKKYPKAKDINIPLDKVDFAFARSSGPGGQNVNKLNTKAELRFEIDSASWIPREVRERLKEYQSNKINNSGELLVTSQEFRTQSRNKEDCVEKLQVMLEEAYVEPKDRKMWVGISKKTKVERRDGKRHRASIKANRGKVNKNDY
jgi:protein subunit release factor B